MKLKKLHNPFPKDPSSIGFLKGRLIYCHKSLQSQSFTAGEGFLIKWHAEHGGYFSINHKEELHRDLWSTGHGESFISGALGHDKVQESRGSITIHDKAQLLLTHQTIEQIQVVWPHQRDLIYHQSNPSEALEVQKKAASFFQEACDSPKDGDGHAVDVRGPAVIVTGCLYADPETASAQLKHYLVSSNNVNMGPFYDTNRSKLARVGVRYWLFFGEKRNHHLGFSLKLDHPVEQAPNLHSLALYHHRRHHRRLPLSDHHNSQFVITQSENMDLLDRMLWLWSRRSLSAFKYEGLRYTFAKFMQPTATFKRLLENDMFVLKDHMLLALEEEVQVEKQDFTSRSNYEKLLQPNNAAFSLEPAGPMGERQLNWKLNRVVLTYAAEEDEGFFGFGEQFSYLNLKGRRVPIMVQEQGLGRGDQPITAAVNLVAERSGGDWHTTYAPVPYYITSKSRCVFLEEYNYSVFDLTNRNKVQIQLHGEAMHGRIVHGQNPLQLIERYTQAIGRMRELPDWILEGAIVGMQGGSQAVRQKWKELKAADVPISAFWLQDWVGQRKTSIGWQLWWNWETDEDHYVGWNQLVKDLKDQGINTMAYLNPFLASVDEKIKMNRHLFEEAKTRGFLVTHPSGGSPYMIPNTSFDAAMVDLTNKEACEWLKEVMHSMIKTGVKGWMADFGESLPLDARLHSNEDPKSAHNRYPEMWAKLNREVVEENGDDELVFFMRAAYMKSPRWASLFWEGDQMVSWQRHDGIKSAVVGLLSGGISGFSFNHSDIGGYCTVDMPFLRYRRSEELLLRWMELNAFSTIFRTHEGNIPSANHQFHTSSASLNHFARFAKVYKAWEFYRKQLVKESSSLGLPVVRPLFLHYWEDPRSLAISYQQFLVGSEILVAPVLDKGHGHVWTYFPSSPDEWTHVWTGTIYSHRPSLVKIRAPLGYPAIFVKSKSPVGHTFLQNLRDLHLICPNEEI